MSAVQASCPACAGSVRFKIGSALVTVCEYCRSVVARGDRKLEDLGKVAEVTDTGAVLELGFQGRYEGVPFELVGRAQLGHAAGGVWDEWYAAFTDGRWGWLAEAQGRYYITFPEDAKLQGIPTFEEIAVGGHVRLPPERTRYVIAEKGVARPLGAQGEMPYRLDPNATYSYADLSGPEGRFGTLDYSESPPLVFTGRGVTLEQLGFAKTRRIREREARKVKGQHLNCPQCAGALELRAPDHTERVGCPNCGSLLDVKEGKLALLQALNAYKVDPVIPLGSKGTFEEGEFTVIGFMQRSTTSHGVEYFWEEYLLYEPHLGVRWLTHENNHWNWVKPLSAGDVNSSAQKASYLESSFKLFQRGEARVTYVAGEFTWKVASGECTQNKDYIAPPQMLSRERSTAGEDESEINWSLCTYLPRQEVAKAFGLPELPRPTGVAPNQPFLHKKIYLYGLYFVGAMLLIGAIFTAFTARRKVHESTHYAAPAKLGVPNVPGAPGAMPTQESRIFFSEMFELKPRRNVAITIRADVNSMGVYVEGELVHKESGEVQPFFVEVGHYAGVEDGESWQDDEREHTVMLSAQAGGNYSLRLEVVPEKPEVGAMVRVRVEQGVVRLITFLLTILGLSVIPVGVGLYHLYFEYLRWQESNCTGSSE